MAFLEPVTLKGRHARLVPLSHDHRDALCEAVCDGELWKLWYTAIPSPEGMKAEIDHSGNPYVEQFIHGRAEGPIKMAIKA